MTPKADGSVGMTATRKRGWEPMKVAYVGNLATVMQSKPGTRGDGGNQIRRSASG